MRIDLTQLREQGLRVNVTADMSAVFIENPVEISGNKVVTDLYATLQKHFGGTLPSNDAMNDHLVQFIKTLHDQTLVQRLLAATHMNVEPDE